ncbi:hepatitis A virus cellular receptor 1-like [Haliotis rufescens]|uniref:hepatitis A virus cellular receptor 1-like n=1 Tax=Haliotis rufescens TaxID=6454 RepID=UPI00201F0406|nr:hepatitis A virus cellular receptor 1-like [Haliotis rufescens]
MVSKTWLWLLYSFTLHVVYIVGTEMPIKVVCYNKMLITDPQCDATHEKMYPKTFTIGRLQNQACSSKIHSPSLRHDEYIQCCHMKDGDTGETYHLPAEAYKFSQHNIMYKEFVTQCIGQARCELRNPGVVHDTNLQDGDLADYVAFEYECVEEKQILHFTGDSTLNDSQIFLLHDQAAQSVKNSYCVAYTCQSSITVTLVGNTVSTSSCNLVMSEEGRTSIAFNCQDNTTSNTLFQSKSNKIGISLNMTANFVTSASEMLWIRVKASHGGLVTVACGPKVPTTVTQHCPKMTTTPSVPSVRPTIPNTSDMPTIPDTPDMPTIPDTSDMPTIPNTSDMPTIPDTPDMPTIPDTSDMPTIPDTSDMPTIPDTSDMPTIPDTSDMPTIPNTSDMPTIPDRSDMPTIQDTSDMPTIPDTSDMPTIPDTSDMPTIPDTSDMPTIPDTSDMPTIPDRSDMPTIPDTSDMPTIPDTSDMPTIPDTSDMPTIPDTSDMPTIPDTSDMPTIPDTSDMPTIPDTPDMPTIADTSDMPTIPDTPDMPTIPDTSDTPTIPDTSDMPTISAIQVRTGTVTTTKSTTVGATAGTAAAAAAATTTPAVIRK